MEQNINCFQNFLTFSVQLLEQELEKVNERLEVITAKYEEASKSADESERMHRWDKDCSVHFWAFILFR